MCLYICIHTYAFTYIYNIYIYIYIYSRGSVLDTRRRVGRAARRHVLERERLPGRARLGVVQRRIAVRLGCERSVYVLDLSRKVQR